MSAGAEAEALTFELEFEGREGDKATRRGPAVGFGAEVECFDVGEI